MPSTPVPIAVVFLVDPRGWVLLMERDEHAPRAPNQWGMVGGHVEPGEDVEVAAYRELLEETGVDLSPDGLRHWLDAEFTYPDGTLFSYGIYTASTTLTDADIVVGEGRRIVFVDPVTISTLDLAPSSGHFLPRFLASDLYQELT